MEFDAWPKGMEEGAPLIKGCHIEVEIWADTGEVYRSIGGILYEDLTALQKTQNQNETLIPIMPNVSWELLVITALLTIATAASFVRRYRSTVRQRT